MSRQTRAVVTGGSAGLGRAFCEALTSDGIAVTSVDCAAPEAASEFEHLQCDLSDRDAVDALVTELAPRGPFDMVIFNAGISATGNFEKIPFDSQSRLLAVNVEAPLVLCAALAASGSLARGARVIFISSLSHQTGYPGAASYAASKGGVAVYARSIRKPFLRDLGVAVCCAFPGPIRTGHAARHAPAGARADKRMAPARAARLILKDAARRKAVIYPGAGAKVFAAAGRLLPKSVTAVMRRMIFDKLENEVW